MAKPFRTEIPIRYRKAMPMPMATPMLTATRASATRTKRAPMGTMTATAMRWAT